MVPVLAVACIRQKNAVSSGRSFAQMKTKTIGVFPAREHAARPRLLAALELALPVRFRGWDGLDAEGLDAVVVLDGSAPDGAATCPR